MQDVCSVLKPHRIHGPVGVASVILYDFENSSAFACPRLRLRMLSTKLRDAQSDTNFVLHSLGEFQ